MEIIIHRGTHQIGGCVTEIKTKETRIIIDMGTSLPGSKIEKELEEAKEAVKGYMPAKLVERNTGALLKALQEVSE